MCAGGHHRLYGQRSARRPTDPITLAKPLAKPKPQPDPKSKSEPLTLADTSADASRGAFVGCASCQLLGLADSA